MDFVFGCLPQPADRTIPLLDAERSHLERRFDETGFHAFGTDRSDGKFVPSSDQDLLLRHFHCHIVPSINQSIDGLLSTIRNELATVLPFSGHESIAVIDDF